MITAEINLSEYKNGDIYCKHGKKDKTIATKCSLNEGVDIGIILKVNLTIGKKKMVCEHIVFT